ncbi:MAG: hypothetical protein ABSE73_31550 [Planctomycetota bacterium]
MSFARAEVRSHNGVPVLFVDGQPLHGMTATSCAFDDPQVVRDFVRGGVEIMMIWIECGIHCWKGPGQYDWSYAEKKLAFFEEHSGNSKWLIRVRLGLLDPWFAKAHPSEVHNPPDAAGNFQGTLSVAVIHSPVWLEHVLRLVRDFTAWLKTTRWAPRILGFMLNAGSTEEWLPFDVGDYYQGKYHPVYTREFRGWLRRRYQDDAAALRRAWRDDKAAFETAPCPTGFMRNGSHIWGYYSLRNPATDRPAVDFYRFLNETLAAHFIAVCRAAKEAAGSPIIAGGFHSYLWWETGVYSYIQEYGHGLIQRLHESPWVDFISDIESYDCRYAGGPGGYIGLPHSCNLHNKLHYTEVDLVTVSNLPPQYRAAWKKADTSGIPPLTAEPVIPDPVYRWEQGYCGRDEEEQAAILQRDHVHNLITGTPYWWFDIRCHNYQEPCIVETLKRLSDIGRQAVNWDRRSLSETAFVCSEDTPAHQAAMNGSLLRFELESNHGLLLDLCTRRWGLAGLPFDIYELNDLRAANFPGGQYKLLIFVNCAVITPQAAEGLRRWQKDGRVFCWTYAPGVLDDNALDPRPNEELIGMRLGWRMHRQNIHVCIEDRKSILTRGGKALSFGTEGSAGPVFFADDPQATVFGRLRDGGEAAFALREHAGWKSVYLAMLNFGPELFRNLARFAGVHVWCESNDVLYANRSLLCLHTASAGRKRIVLPAPAVLSDLWTGEQSDGRVTEIEPDLPRFRTKVWRMET